MFIDSLALRNFRLFEETTVGFHDRTSVIVGINGAGKSTILDAMGILLSCYVGGFDGLGARRISQSDIRHVTRKIGSTYENMPQLPVKISANGSIGSTPVSWGSVKLKDSPQSSSPSAYDEISKIAAEHQVRLREGDESLSLPLIAYYGTGRLWKRDPSKKRVESRLHAPFRRLAAYDDCLDAHLTDTSLVAFYERMSYKHFLQGEVPPEYAAVRSALKKGLETLTGLSLEAVFVNFDTHELEITFEDAGIPVRTTASQLSDGYRVALNMFADIAYRAATLNPQLGNAALAETEGIVLIDEVDLHLHPQWQQLVLKDLADTFPRLQFVVTTHAPSVISSTSDSQLIIVDGIKARTSDRSFYGRDVNSVLRELMDVPERPRAVKALFDKFYDLVDASDYDKAQGVLDSLRALLGDSDVELGACEVQLDLERMDLS
jgi:predicted ATP-binding protein involved in virulence